MHWLPSAALLANFLAQAPSVDAGLIGWRRGVVAASHGHLQSDSQSQVGTNAGALVKDNPETGEETLECVHVSNPVLAHHGIMAGSEAVDLPDDVPDYCQLVLVDYVFANSDGRPFIGNYQPPNCSFSRVVIGATIESQGPQYDRVGSLWLGDVLIWSTSTAQPKHHPGVSWGHWKDVSHYLALWREPQTVIMDLANAINGQYYGYYHLKVTASFIDEELVGPQAPPAEMVMAISARRSSQSQGSAFIYPDEKAESLMRLPVNIKRAVVTLAAYGQGEEAFWWANVPERGVAKFQNVTLPGQGSFREVRLRIDGKLVGFSWPFPMVFAGGISPPLHRPLAGIKAFDMHEHEIDVTPWLGLLCDGEEHKFSMEVLDGNEEPVQRYWVLSGKIFLWLDPSGAATTGRHPKMTIKAGKADVRVDTKSKKYLLYSERVTRKLEARTQLRRNGERLKTSWRQRFVMKNKGYVGRCGNFQQVEGTYTGEDVAVEDLTEYYISKYRYPIAVSYEVKAPSGSYRLKVEAQLVQGLDQTLIGRAVFPTGIEPFLKRLREPKRGVDVTTRRSGQAVFYQREDGSFSGGFGRARQRYGLGARGLHDSREDGFAPYPLLYRRDVSADNGTVTMDEQHLYRSKVKYATRYGDALRVGEGGGDWFAPMAIRGRGGSRIFSGKELEVGPWQGGEDVVEGEEVGGGMGVRDAASWLSSKR